MVVASSAALIAVSLHSIVDFSYNTSEFWMFAGFGMAALKISKAEIEEASASQSAARRLAHDQ
jgi:hypothetical protein